MGEAAVVLRPELAPTSPVGPLAVSLRLGRRRLWAMLHAYFDESGTHRDSKILVLAGLISSVEQWSRLERSWLRVLDDHALPAFHTTDCAHGVKAFAGWSAADRDALYRRLVSLAKRHVLWRTWTAVVVPEYLQFFGAKADEAFANAYSVAATACASCIRTLAVHRGERIPYTFEAGGLGGRLAARMFSELIDSGRSDYYGMEALVLGRRDTFVPLQVADLHAYEVYRYFSDQTRPRAPGERPTIRRSFYELMRIPEAGGGGYLLGLEKLRTWFDSMRRGELVTSIPPDPLRHDCLTAMQWLAEGHTDG